MVHWVCTWIDGVESCLTVFFQPTPINHSKCQTLLNVLQSILLVHAVTCPCRGIVVLVSEHHVTVSSCDSVIGNTMKDILEEVLEEVGLEEETALEQFI